MVGSSVSECNKEKFIFGLDKGGHYNEDKAHPIITSEK